MPCEAWSAKLALFVDAELPPDQNSEMEQHLRGCSACAATALASIQGKHALQQAGRKFHPDPAFRARIYREVERRHKDRRIWSIVSAGALAALVIAGVLLISLTRRQTNEQLLGEIADLHVSTLASQNPVDVVSTDRHTVKPWFEGKLPFTFDLPELENTPFTLVGGKVIYLRQAPGAELIFGLRQHRISLFIFQQRAVGSLHGAEITLPGSSLNLHAWSNNGLEYLLIGDVGNDDLNRLQALLRSAG
ncbi:MAG TPA: zf-HC2 domain-containing protein [Terriglobales bacterium]|nr:zf-HC2 domain-containing protein [Terriglobales bacterium]